MPLTVPSSGASGTASITGGTATGLTSLGIRNAGTGAFDLTLAHNGTLTAGRTLTFDVGDANRTLTLGGNLTLTGGGTIALGGYALTIPATGTAALLGTANVFTGIQTITPAVNAKALIVTGVTHTASAPVFDLAQTWNNAGVTFVGQDFTFTRTAAATGSLMARWTTTGRGSVAFDEIGEILIGSIGNAGLRTGNGGIAGTNGGTLHVGCYNGGVYLGSTNVFGGDVLIYGGALSKMSLRSALVFGWSSDSTSYGTMDLLLVRKAAATLQLGIDAAGVTNQMLTAASRITSDGVGANLTIAGGNGRGGAGGSLILATYDTAGAGTAGTLTSRLTIDTAGNFDFNLTATA